MAGQNKKLFLFISTCILSLSIFGCMSKPPQKEEQYINDSKTDIFENKESPDYAEGLLPPANQNILLPYYVQDGDNLAKISKKIYGKGNGWKKIAEINKLIDPNKIYAGDVIYYQLTSETKVFAEKYEGAPRAKIIVKRGDTLSSISQAVFGKAKDWRVLWKENPHISNPDKLKVGMTVYFRPKALTAEIRGGYELPAQPLKDSEQDKLLDKKAEGEVTKEENLNKEPENILKTEYKENNSKDLSNEELSNSKVGAVEKSLSPEKTENDVIENEQK